MAKNFFAGIITSDMKNLFNDAIEPDLYLNRFNKLLIKDLILSILIENIIPAIIPVMVAREPIENPTIKKILVIEEF